MNIAVLISGGVDSSVALAKLVHEGHAVTAFYLKIWLEDELSYLGSCPWQEDLGYVQAVCDHLGVSLEVVSLQQEYWDHVVSYTIAEVKQGRTPNPDVLCNSRIKFGFFLDYLEKRYPGVFDTIATGHYAQLQKKSSLYYLKQSPDPVKDQTYFLSYLTQQQLARLAFPIGHLDKSEVRSLAAQFNLPNKDRKDSQGICFLGKLKFHDFIRHYLGDSPGDLIEYETGKIVGTHQGFWYYTIGQRQGIGLAGGPWYVVAKDTQVNKVYISRNYYAPDKQRNAFEVAQLNWVGVCEGQYQNIQVKMRHGAYAHNCCITSRSAGKLQVTLAHQDQGIAAGQFAVFYHNAICLGAGIIQG